MDPESVRTDTELSGRRRFWHTLASAYQIEAGLVFGLILVVGFIIWVLFKSDSQSTTSQFLQKELLDILKTLLGALITWGTIIVNSVAHKE